MNRRDLLLAGSYLASGLLPFPQAWAEMSYTPKGGSDPDWAALVRPVEGRLAAVEWPLEPCLANAGGADCSAFLASDRNPYFLYDNPAITTTLGWVDAWVS